MERDPTNVVYTSFFFLSMQNTCNNMYVRLIVFCVGGSKEPTVLYIYLYILTIERYIIILTIERYILLTYIYNNTTEVVTAAVCVPCPGLFFATAVVAVAKNKHGPLPQKLYLQILCNMGE